MAGGLEFENLNPLNNLEYLEAGSAAELLGLIKQIRLPIRIISIYHTGPKHIAWIQGHFKKSTKTKGVKNG